MKQMVFAVSGVKNSGKTTMVERLVTEFIRRGYSVATIKHDAHHFDADVPGRDSYRHRAAGAYGTAVFDEEKYMLIKNGQQTIEGLITQFPEADMVILEGAKQTGWPKIEVVRAGNSEKSVCDASTLIALATNLPLVAPGIPVEDIDDIATLADLTLAYFEKNKNVENGKKWLLNK